MKQYILIRSDKKIPLGKLMAHCAHNSLSAYLNSEVNNTMSNRIYDWYYGNHQKKIVVIGGSKRDIQKIVDQAQDEGIPASFLDDINTNIQVCGVVGPVTDEESYHLGLADLPLYR